VTTLFAEHTGNHPPLEIDWSAEKRVPMRFNGASDTESPVDAEPEEEVALTTSHADPVLADVGPTVAEVPIVAGDISPAVEPANQPEAATSFSSFWDFARAVNRSDPAALALAGNGADMEIEMDARELRKLLGTFWFRSVFPQLSKSWQDRVLTVVTEHVSVPDHLVGKGRNAVHLRQMSAEQRQRMMSDPTVPDDVRSDVQLVTTVAMLWGEDALGRFEFTAAPQAADSSRLAALLQPFRH